MFQITDSPFYRVAAKAIIFDESQNILALQNDKGGWEIPGGGWEHDEGLEQCLSREIQEELGVSVESVRQIVCIYQGISHRHGFRTFRVAAITQLSSFEFTLEDQMKEAKFLSREEFMKIDFMRAEGNIQDFADIIWGAVEKKPVSL